MEDNTANCKEKHIIYCDCRGERIQHGIKESVENALQLADAEITILSDLCGLAVLNKDSLKKLFDGGNPTLVIGCYERTMTLLFSQNGIDLSSKNTEYLNLIEENSDNAIQAINKFTGKTNGSAACKRIIADPEWPSWYPIIDYSRCTACRQCADFCLFGVYEKSQARVDVIYPQECKNNCPACARICPQSALIFPKYKHGGAIGGSGKIDEVAELTRQTKDISDFLGGDVYAALEKRKLKRQSIITEEAMKKAVKEKEKAINEGNQR